MGKPSHSSQRCGILNQIKTHPNPAGLTVLAIAALTGIAPLAAQEAAPAPVQPAATAEPAAASAPAIQFRVEAERSVPMADGGRLILQRVAEPVLPPPQVQPPQLSPGERQARFAARHGGMKSFHTLWFFVTLHPDGLSYVEWWPAGGAGAYGAWSRADFRYMSMIPDFDVASTETRYRVLPAIIRHPRRGSAAVEPPSIPADGPGFVLVNGDPANTSATAALDAIHKIYRRDYATLKTGYEERQVAAAVAAAKPPPPPPPPRDVVIKFWPLRSEPAPTPAPAAR